MYRKRTGNATLNACNRFISVCSRRQKAVTQSSSSVTISVTRHLHAGSWRQDVSVVNIRYSYYQTCLENLLLSLHKVDSHATVITVTAVLPPLLLLLVLTSCHPSLADDEEYRLMRHLMKSYDRRVRPSMNASESLNVTFGLALAQIIDVVSTQLY